METERSGEDSSPPGVVSPSRRHLWDFQAVRDLFLIGAIGAFVWASIALRMVLVPVLVPLFLAYLIHPLISRVAERWRVPRAVSSGVVVALGVCSMLAFLWWLGPVVVQQASTLADRLPEYTRSLAQRLRLRDLGVSEAIQGWFDDLGADPARLLRQLAQTSGHALAIVKGVVGAAAYVVLCAVLMPILFFIFTWRFDAIVASLTRFLPKRRGPRIKAVLAKMDRAVAGFFRGRVVISVIVGAILSAGWALVDVPYWFLLGVLTGFLNIIPYASTVSWPLAVILKYADTELSGGNVDWVSVVVWPVLVFFAAQVIENWFLTPWIQSEQTDLSAAAVLIVVLIGGAAFGFMGMLFAIPVAACIKIFFADVVAPQLHQWAETH